MPSLQRYLLLGSGAVMIVVFTALGGLLFASVRGWMIAELDRGLLAQADSLALAAELHPQSMQIDFEGDPPAYFLGGAQAQYFELWEGAKAARRSPSLGGRDLSYIAAGPGTPSYQFVTLPDGRAGRQIALAFSPRNAEDEQSSVTPAKRVSATVTLMLARDTIPLSAALLRLRWLLAGACGTALLTCMGFMTWIIRRALRPVAEIGERISGVGRRNLSDRLAATGVPRELLPIVQRLNEMLGRLESAFTRERAFAADVAHELRTPLAGLETSLEVCASRPREPAEYQKVVDRCLTVTRQMHAMVDTLLTLARAEAGAMGIARSRFSLPELIEESWQTFDQAAAARGVQVSRTTGQEQFIFGDREKLRLILYNLFDNAVTYSDDGGRVWVDAARRDGMVELMIANTGSQLSDEKAQHVFERFWRGDVARSSGGVHCGLGLSIARELVGLLDGSITVKSDEGGEFRVRVSMPEQPAAFTRPQ